MISNLISKKILVLIILFSIGVSSAYSVSETIPPSSSTGSSDTRTIMPEETMTEVKPPFNTRTIPETSSSSTSSSDSNTSLMRTTTPHPPFSSETIFDSTNIATVSDRIITKTATISTFSTDNVMPTTSSVLGVSSGLIIVPVITTSVVSPNNFMATGDSSTLVSEPVIIFDPVTPNTFTVLGVSIELPPMFMPVGGELIPIDSTVLVLAGAQSTASWLIPVIVAGAGIGIIILRKF